MVGCAGKKEPASITPQDTTPAAEDPSARSEGLTISPAAARIYMLGEQRYAEGHFDEAVALWGHAMLQLPADPSADSIRHKLVARMGYGLLQAHQATGDMTYLVDGQTMCELYVAKHEALFGDDDEARAERGEIYELLYEFDSRLDGQPLEDDAQEPTQVATTEDSPAPAEPDAPPTETSREDYRIVNVRRIAWADPDDPRVRGFLRDTRFTGPSNLDHGGDDVHGPRVLVRVGALPRPEAATADAKLRSAAREASMAIVEAARPALERCYEVAMSRRPVVASRVEVALTVGPDGAVTQPRLTDGMVVDAEGDVCTVQALTHAVVETPPVAAIDVVMPIHFFYQDATKTAELFRRERPQTGRAYELTSRTTGLPPIDEFVPQVQSFTPAWSQRGVPQVDPSQIRD